MYKYLLTVLLALGIFLGDRRLSLGVQECNLEVFTRAYIYIVEKDRKHEWRWLQVVCLRI